MTDLAVIILQKNEALHIRRCLEKLRPLAPRQVFVVDCFSTDGSDRMAQELGATVAYHEWPGNQAAQFNWALDNLPINAAWILRLDADEYLTEAAIHEIHGFVATPEEGVSLAALPLKRTWQRRFIRFGVPRIYIPRLFRSGTCRYGTCEMDEKLVPHTGRTVRLTHEFVDDNLNGLAWWKTKHLGYAEREARQALQGARGNKVLYYKMPPFARAVAYWALRYFIYGGFLDGRAGWSWNWWQGLWYRWQVDRKIGQLKRKRHCGSGDLI